MDNFISFLLEWQNLVGSAIGAIIAIGGSFLILYIRYLMDLRSNNKEQYNKLIAIVYELHRTIGRCEFFIESLQNNIVSFAHIFTPTFDSQWSQIRISGIHPKIYNSIQKIYGIIDIVVYNIDKANVVETKLHKDKEGNTVQTQKSIIDERYRRAIAFIKEYLKDMYKNFNIVYIEVSRYAKDNRFEFPHDLNGYSKEYVECRNRLYTLKDTKIN